MTTTNIDELVTNVNNSIKKSQEINKRAKELEQEAEKYRQNALDNLRNYLSTITSVSDIYNIYNLRMLDDYSIVANAKECKRRLHNICKEYNVDKYVEIGLGSGFIRIRVNRQDGISDEDTNTIINFLHKDNLPDSYRCYLIVEDVPNDDVSRAVVYDYETTLGELNASFIKKHLV